MSFSGEKVCEWQVDSLCRNCWRFNGSSSPAALCPFHSSIVLIVALFAAVTYFCSFFAFTFLFADCPIDISNFNVSLCRSNLYLLPFYLLIAIVIGLARGRGARAIDRTIDSALSALSNLLFLAFCSSGISSFLSLYLLAPFISRHGLMTSITLEYDANRSLNLRLPLGRTWQCLSSPIAFYWSPSFIVVLRLGFPFL